MANKKSLSFRAVRRARRSPTIRKMSVKVIDRVRASETALDVVNRVYAGSGPTRDTPPRPYPPIGNLLSGLGRYHLPVAVVSLIDTPADRVDEVIDEIARLQVLTGSFRPFFLLNCNRLDSARRYGFGADLLIERDQWVDLEQTWSEYAAARVAHLRDIFDAVLVTHVPEKGVTDGVRVLLASLRDDHLRGD